MGRIPLASLADPAIPQQWRDRFQRIAGQRGFQPNVLRALANNPAILSEVTALHVAIDGGGLTEAQLQLAYLTASAANACHY